MDKQEQFSKAKLYQISNRWLLPPIPQELRMLVEKHQEKQNLKHIANWVREALGETKALEKRTKVELATLDWLYDCVRGNIKRGRVFELKQVLTEGRADCLGYAKIFDILGKNFGLDIGIVEVVIDNAGRYVPHSINILKLSDKRTLLVDPWYGSKNINHRRVGVQIKEKGKGQIKDIDWEEREKMEDVQGLPPECIDAITYYIIGNRHLEQWIRYPKEKELDRAIEYYDAAIKLYPQNARFYFNRAIAFENKGEREKAESDYAQALKDEASQMRVLAREYEESVQLIELDQRNISPEEQEIYLPGRGFITGKETPTESIARKYGISKSEVERIVSEIVAKLSN